MESTNHEQRKNKRPKQPTGVRHENPNTQTVFSTLTHGNRPTGGSKHPIGPELKQTYKPPNRRFVSIKTVSNLNPNGQLHNASSQQIDAFQN